MMKGSLIGHLSRKNVVQKKDVFLNDALFLERHLLALNGIKRCLSNLNVKSYLFLHVTDDFDKNGYLFKSKPFTQKST
jgi:hypothetical protein